MAPSDDNQTRRHERHSLLLKIDFDSPGLPADYLTNLSEGGLFIHTDSHFSIGDRIRFTVSFPGLVDPIICQAVVRWHRTQQDGELPAGVGAQFVWESEEEQRDMLQLIERLEAPLVLAPEEPYRVLIADGDDLVAELFRQGIGRAHQTAGEGSMLQVQAVTSGDEAWEVLRREAFDLAILDIHLPGVSGIELAARMRKSDLPVRPERPGTCAIALSSAGGYKERKAARGAGVDLIIDKPVLFNWLVRSLGKLIGQR